jgi:thioredoxin 1
VGTVALTQAGFARAISVEGIVLVDFWAAWCGPCQRFGPIFEQVSNRYRGIVFAKVDTEAEPALAASYDITSIPTLIAFRGGVMVFNQAGALAESGLDQVIAAVRGLDMREVYQVSGQRPAAADRGSPLLGRRAQNWPPGRLG